jgi:hypothetical protein
LASDTNRAVSLFGKAALVYNKATGRLAAEQAVGIPERVNDFDTAGFDI